MAENTLTASTKVGLVVCRGCCCGSPAKDPATDHEAQLEQLQRFAVDNLSEVAVRTSLCLGPCEYANIIVVQPSPAGRLRGGRPVWFGLVDDYALNKLQAWVATGGPGLSDVPPELQLQEIGRPRRKAERGA
ncbi:MAG TPA: hypothetical protein DGT23_34565 [Micromonosporaceae bacterium]|nr:hypothetical protein [Micromonosporaceae bacterium]